MFKTIAKLRTANFVQRLMLALTFMLGLTAASHADASALETGATTAISGLATTAGTLLLAALAVVVGFAVFKIVKKAMGKA